MKFLIPGLFSLALLSTQAQKAVYTETEAKTLINSLYEKLMHGAGFAELAEANSEDPGTKGQGGRYENVNKETLTPEFENALAHLKVNEISKPFKTKYGYDIAQLLKKQNKTYSFRHILIIYKK